MKALLFTLLLFVFCPSFAQEAVHPFKKANTIIVTTTDTPNKAYKQLAALLLDKGYTLDKTDPDLLSISTDQKVIRRAAVKLNCYVRSGEQTIIIFKGQSGLPNDRFNLSPLYYGGMKGSPLLLAWEEMQAVAATYPNGTITYRAE